MSKNTHSIQQRQVSIANKIKKSEQIKFNVPLGELMNALEMLKKHNEEIRSLGSLLNLGHVTLTYEDLVSDQDKELRKLFNFLSVDENIKVESETKKLSTDRISDIVENYDEMAQLLIGSEYEQYL